MSSLIWNSRCTEVFCTAYNALCPFYNSALVWDSWYTLDVSCTTRHLKQSGSNLHYIGWTNLHPQNNSYMSDITCISWTYMSDITCISWTTDMSDLTCISLTTDTHQIHVGSTCISLTTDPYCITYTCWIKLASARQQIPVRSNLQKLDTWYLQETWCMLELASAGQGIHVRYNLHQLHNWYMSDLTYISWTTDTCQI